MRQGRATQLKHLHDNDPWMLAENIPDCDIFFFQIPASCFTNDVSFPFITLYGKFIATYRRFEQNFYFGEKNSFAVGESILKALIERPKFGAELNKSIVVWSHKLIAFAKRASELPLPAYSNQKLWQLYKQHDDIHTKLYTYGWLPVAVDMFHNNLTNHLKRYLRTVCSGPEQVEQAFVILTTPTRQTIVAQEREEFLRIYDKHRRELKKLPKGAKADRMSAALQKDLAVHAHAWGHLGYIFAGNHPPFSAQHYLNEMIDLVKSGLDGKELLKKDADYLRTAGAKKRAWYRKFKVDGLHRRLCDAAAEFALTKLVRRHAQLFTLHCLHCSLLAEIANRLKLTRYQVQFMLKDEVKDALLGGKVLKHTLVQRLKYCVYYTEAGVEAIYTGEKAKKLFKKVASLVSVDVNEIKGQTANPGKAQGTVKIIIRAKDMPKMKQGDVLVSIATDPDIVPAMKKASAIVTEQGGITSHAAIVSRELGIPCVIGTKIATRVLHDGELVEVDATRGIVRKL